MPKARVKPLPVEWEVSREITVNGRTVVPGTELSIRGESGRFRFIKFVRNGDHEWVDVIGGVKGRMQYRAFAPRRVKTVHRLTRLRPPA